MKQSIFARPLRLAVISDMHVGFARSKDLYPSIGKDAKNRDYAELREAADVTEATYVDDFVRFAHHKGLQADYLLVPGDVSNGGEHQAISVGSDALIRCASALGVSTNKILFVPGNHDVFWSIMQVAGGTQFYYDQRFNGFSDPALVFKSIVDRAEGSPFVEPYFSIWNEPELLAVGYNTAWNDGPDHNPHHGHVDPAHLKALDSRLKEFRRDPGQVRLCLFHHHPMQYRDPTGWRDFSVLQNAQDLFDLLWKHGFDLVVHGHRHQPVLTPHSQGMGRHLAVLCAGSFSTILYPGWKSQIGNQFHILEVEGRSSPRGGVLGMVRSWTYLTGLQWCESRQDRDGIAHREVFGAYYDEDHLLTILRPMLKTRFAAGNYVEWTEITGSQPDLARVPAKLVLMVLTELKGEFGYDIIESKEEEYVLLRGRSVETAS